MDFVSFVLPLLIALCISLWLMFGRGKGGDDG